MAEGEWTMCDFSVSCKYSIYWRMNLTLIFLSNIHDEMIWNVRRDILPPVCNDYIMLLLPWISNQSNNFHQYLWWFCIYWKKKNKTEFVLPIWIFVCLIIYLCLCYLFNNRLLLINEFENCLFYGGLINFHINWLNN